MFALNYAALLCLVVCALGSGETDDNSWTDTSYKFSESSKMAQLTSIETEHPISSQNCVSIPEGGIEWLVYVRGSDYGWKQDTARAITALAVNGWSYGTREEIRQMELQLDVELTNILLRNGSSPLYPTQLALYIQALVALNRNPRDFHGIDLVSILLHKVETMRDTHPFVVLSLCNARAVSLHHLKAIRQYTVHNDVETRQTTELKSLALKAFACAASLDNSLAKFGQEMTTAANCISLKQKDVGSFGNLYTTALAVQALISSKSTVQWDREAALNYLQFHAPTEKSVMGIYAIELALKASTCPFVKDLHPYNPLSKVQEQTQSLGPSIYYTVRNDRRTDVEFTLSLRIPQNSNFFDVMKLSMEKDPNFRFSYYLDSDKLPMVFAVDGLPNDAEENYYWRLCKQMPTRNDTNRSYLRTVPTSPKAEKTDHSSHYILWYTNLQCESRN